MPSNAHGVHVNLQHASQVLTALLAAHTWQSACRSLARFEKKRYDRRLLVVHGVHHRSLVTLGLALAVLVLALAAFAFALAALGAVVLVPTRRREVARLSKIVAGPRLLVARLVLAYYCPYPCPSTSRR